MLVRSEQCRSAFVRFNYNHNLNALMSEPTLVGKTKVEFERREKSIFANERYLNIKYTNTKKTSLATISSFRRIQKFSISLKSFKNIRVFLITVNMPTSFHLMMMKKNLQVSVFIWVFGCCGSENAEFSGWTFRLNIWGEKVTESWALNSKYPLT